MKNVRNLFLLTCILIIATLSLTGCGTSNTEADATDATTTDVATDKEVEIDYTKEAEKNLLAIANAHTEDELKSAITEDSFDTVNDILSSFPDDNYSVSAELLGTYSDYDVYNFEVTNKDTKESKSGCGLFKKVNDAYLFCNNTSVLNTFVQNTQCSTCGGSGSIYTGGNTCGICGGTGKMFNPNMNFDPNTNSYYGGMDTCTGCAGAGKIGTNTNICPSCNGTCFILK